MDLGKPNFSVVHHSNCDAFIVVLQPTVSTYLSAVDVGSVPHISTMIFKTHAANSAVPMRQRAEMTQASLLHLGYHYDICWC